MLRYCANASGLLFFAQLVSIARDFALFVALRF